MFREKVESTIVMGANAPKSFGIHTIAQFFKSLAIGIIVFLVALFLLKDIIIQNVAQYVGSSVIGAPVTIGQFSWGTLTQKIVLKDIKISNPSGFPKGELLHISLVTVKYDWIELMRGHAHMPLVIVDLKEMTVVKNSEGKLNVDALKVVHPEEKTKAEILPFQIDILKLNIGQVFYKDYFKKTDPQILVYDVHLKDKTLKNINSIPKLLTAVIVVAMKPTAIKGAAIYAAAAVMGVGFLPGAVLGIVIAKDDAVEDFPVGVAKAFDVGIKFIKERGNLIKADKNKWAIDGNVQGVDVKIRFQKLSWFKTRVVVSARKYMLPKPEFASGILYQIGEKL